MKITNLAGAAPLAVLALCLLCSGATARSVLDDLNGLEDTVVDIGVEPAAHSIFKRSALVEDIMGPLSRNVRQVDEKTRSMLVYHHMKILHSILEMLLGGNPRVDIFQFINWDKTIQIDQLFYVKPKTVWEARRVILAARRLGMHVRATGAGHSRSPLYVDEGNIMMDVRDLQRHDGPFMELNQERPGRDFKTVTAMTGVYEVELNEFMTKEGVAILAQPLNDQETLGGMVAASTHGSTWSAPTYSGIVVEMRLLDSHGRLRRFTKEDHPMIMKAASCNLGMFGIMYDITIKVEPTFVVKAENRFVRLGDLMLNKDALRAQVTGSFLTEISWFPFNKISDAAAEEYSRTGAIPDDWSAADDTVWLRTINRAQQSEYQGQTILGPSYLPTKGSLSGGNVTGLLRGRGAIDIAKKLSPKSFHYLVNAFPVILPPRWGTETSAAFMLNIDNSFDRVYRAFNFMISRSEQQIRDNGTTPMNALLPRFFQNHECFLCPGNAEIQMPNDSGRTLVIDFLAPPAQQGFYKAAADFVEFFKNEKVRPHWAKRHDNIAGIIDHVKDVYGSLLPGFSEQKRLARVDPCDMFMNSYLIAIFGRSQSCY
ncbi:uncharacterized protein LOC101860474 [Aplysia californica]|uniref:Uncharacterized protein LOC101860474 n=1 Tax=Aplysia californica TaxID=6500 RepID=A0ABM1AFP5_APLCA|nr:uncharacterized protein LOC101860474 [Aplysia californica]XP_012946739.1 uncharacterized protein LOC101860474 [Aplysia californica]